MKSLEIDARFALGASLQRLLTCGPETTAGQLKEYLTSDQEFNLSPLLEKLPNLDVFQKALAAARGLKPFDREVQRNYWLGGPLVENDLRYYDLLLDLYQQHGWADFLIKELRQKRPPRLYLTHNFQVTWFGVADMGGVISHDLRPVNACLIRTGEVLERLEEKVKVRTFVLYPKIGGGITLAKTSQTARVDPQINPEVKPGNHVALHWGSVAMVVTPEEREQLESTTARVAEML